MPSFKTSLIILCVLALVPACSDDGGAGKDSAIPDKGTADKLVQDLSADAKKGDAKTGDTTGDSADAAGDAKTGDAQAGDAKADTLVLSSAKLKSDTIAMVTLLANKLPAVAGSAKVETYIPKDNAVTGWVEDKAVGKPGVEAGYNEKDILAIINGSHDDYHKAGCTGFAKQDYALGKYKMTLFLWHMNTAAAAASMFTKNKTEGETQAGLTFSTITGVKDKAIIADDLPQWKAYAHKGPYIFKIYTLYLP